MSSLFSEIRPYLRGLGREPALPCLSVALLVLGIGGSSVVFTVVHRALLRPLPVRDQDRLQTVWMRDLGADEPHIEIAFPHYEELRRETAGVESMAAFSSNRWSYVIMDAAEPYSADAAREQARSSGLHNLDFDVATAKNDWDFVANFDCLHDMGDPAGVAAHIHQSLKPDGTWMIVEPIAGDSLQENLNPVGRLYYAFSTQVCTPASLSQEVGAALGAQAGEMKLKEVVQSGGFTRFRRATETPFNMILEARP